MRILFKKNDDIFFWQRKTCHDFEYLKFIIISFFVGMCCWWLMSPIFFLTFFISIIFCISLYIFSLRICDHIYNFFLRIYYCIVSISLNFYLPISYSEKILEYRNSFFEFFIFDTIFPGKEVHIIILWSHDADMCVARSRFHDADMLARFGMATTLKSQPALVLASTLTY